ncbi:MAG TPA: sigma 54-interacting transcriptional regulator, partial [Polyangiaceae bacterium]|nr:sigma 54-interacting transcriptional regulator [Polyangiaceae bacterium]
MIVWSAAEPHRVGEVLLIPRGRTIAFGRGASGDAPSKVRLVRQRPGKNLPMPALEDRFLSRRQLVIESDGDVLHVTSVGRRSLVVRGVPVEKVSVSAGEQVEIKDTLIFLCVRRTAEMPLLKYGGAAPEHAFGRPDPHGILGESPAAWRLRESIAFVASKTGHGLVTGPSGAGKELVAHALHDLSARRKRRFVSRSAATFPPGLIDAELFGNIANYPHAGMPERLGLVGEA